MEKEKSNLKGYTVPETRPGFCPRCGAYVGGFYKCTECHSKMPHGTKLRIKQGVVIIAVIFGLLGLSIYARIDPAPEVDIGDIGSTYSNGLVTIEGEITNIDLREASDDSWRTLYFTVEDNTGSIEVKAYTETTDEIIEEKNTPAIGDDCEVRGSVYIKGDELYILLDSSNYLEIDRDIDYELTSTELANLYAADPDKYEGKRVEVTGLVSWVDEDDSYFDLDSSIRIYFPEYVRDFAPDVSISVVAGDRVEVVGIIDEYFGIVEVLPGSMYDFEILD